MAPPGLPGVDNTTEAASKEESELASELSVKHETATKQPPVSQLVRRQPRARNRKCLLPKRLKLSAIKVCRYYRQLPNHTCLTQV